jgi:iron(III) transport system permease protein
MAVVASPAATPVHTGSAGRALDSVRRGWAGWVLTIILAVLILYPLGMLFWASLHSGGPNDPTSTFTLANYQKVFSTASTYELIWTTTWLAVVRVILASAIGIFLAWVVTRTDTPWRRGIEVLVWIKFFAPPLPILVAWALLAGKNGLLNAMAQQLPFVTGPIFDIYSFAGIIWVSTINLAALFFLLTVPAFRSMDATLEDSARLCGASRLQTLRNVTVPVLLPTILGAVFLALIFVLESFEAEVLFGSPAKIYVLSTRIFAFTQEFPPDLPSATALSSVFLLAVAVLIIIQLRLLGGRSFITVSGRGFNTQPTPLGPWRWVTFAICILYFLIAAVIPLSVLVLGSVMQAWGVWNFSSLTGEHWRTALADPRLGLAMRNTVTLGVAVGVFGTIVCALAAYVIVRTRSKARMLLEFITWAPRTVPGAVLGIAFLWAYVGGLWVFRPLYGTLAMLVIVLIANGIPLGSRLANGAIHQVAEELEEAAWVSGASWLHSFREVLVPIMAPALLTSFLFLFLSAIRNLVLVVFFYRPESRVLSTILWESWTGGTPERALVSGLVMMLMAAVALSLALLLRRKVNVASV